MLKKEKEKKWKCDICNFSTEHKSCLKRHKKRKHGHDSASSPTRPETYLCDVCPKEFLSKCGLRRHRMAIYTKEFKYKCSTCDKGYNDMWNFKGHLPSHSTVLCEKCTVCGTSFNYKSSLNRHLQTCGKTVSISCETCNKKFLSKSGLADHVSAEHSNREYKCNYCEKTYKWRLSLKKHTDRCQQRLWHVLT